MSYEEKIILNNQGLGGLQYWIENLKYFHGRYVIQDQPQIVIQTEAELEGWGANCMGMEAEGKLSIEERKHNINILELQPVKNASSTLTKKKTIYAIHIEIDKTT